MDTEDFNIITLNCWGVFPPLFCEKRVERLAAIAEKLSEGDYDIVLLQELYLPDDYYKMRSALKCKYPYSNYFHSMLIGSGCCIFTKFKIKRTFFFPFTLNGYSHKVEHGDYYAGKGIGLSVLQTSKNFTINVYVTHTHARYQSLTQDSYAAHRLNQAFELGQFIYLTSQGCDAVILGGDFNMNGGMVGFDMIPANTGLKDAWLTQEIKPENPEIQGATSCRPDNSFCCKNWLAMHANGERLDYIFYKQNAGYRLTCKSCNLTMRRISELNNISYSDHEAVGACFQLAYDEKALPDKPNEELLLDLCSRGVKEYENVSNKFIFYQMIRVLLLVCLLIVILFNFPNLTLYMLTGYQIPGLLNQTLTLMMSIIFFMFLWHAVIIKTAERKSIKNSIQSMKWIINSISSYRNGNANHCNESYKNIYY